MKLDKWLILLTFSLVFMACNKAPRGIIKESDMVDLLVDLHKADAYVDNYPSQFPDDSTLMMLKQSVFMKHGVSQSEYDTSLVWYAHNMDAYTDVYRRVIEKLKDEQGNAVKYGENMPKKRIHTIAGKPYHTVDGDTADLWSLSRYWLLPHGLKNGYVPFECDPDRDNSLGDCYEVLFKNTGGRNMISVFLAVDYSDGGTAFVNHKNCSSGWNRLQLQTDSMRSVRRIYGYLNYRLKPGAIAYIDSVQLLRTHIDSQNYSFRISAQHVVERMVNRSGQQQAEPPKSVHVIDKASFRPKEGVNKSNIKRHIENSPNARHLPSRR